MNHTDICRTAPSVDYDRLILAVFKADKDQFAAFPAEPEDERGLAKNRAGPGYMAHFAVPVILPDGLQSSGIFPLDGNDVSVKWLNRQKLRYSITVDINDCQVAGWLVGNHFHVPFWLSFAGKRDPVDAVCAAHIGVTGIRSVIVEIAVVFGKSGDQRMQPVDFVRFRIKTADHHITWI